MPCSSPKRLSVGPIVYMSESAAIVKLFFFRSLNPSACLSTLQAAGAEDKSLLGSKLSTDSGTKTRLGFSAQSCAPALSSFAGIGISATNPRGLGMESPEKHSPFSSTRFVQSAHSEIPLFRRTHVSALNFCMSLFRRPGVAIIFSLTGLVD